jgi:hypothetical protein
MNINAIDNSDIATVIVAAMSIPSQNVFLEFSSGVHAHLDVSSHFSD